METIDVVILAGGLGTRIQSTLKNTPKVLAPVGDRVFLDILIDWLGGFGARRLVLGLGHLAESVTAHLEKTDIGGIEIVPVIEPAPLGTAGAIRHLAQHINSDPVLVMNGDSYVDADLCRFADAYAKAGCDGALLCAEVDDSARYGCIDLGPDQSIRRFAEKTGQAAPGVISAGVYLFGASLLARIMETDGPSLERDVLENLPAGSLHAMTGRFPFVDIGTPESLHDAPGIILPDTGAN